MRGIEGRVSPSMAKVIDEKDVAGGDGYSISSYRELVTTCAELAYLNKDNLLFFRGQGVDYRNRSEKSTFYPSIYRDDYLRKREVEHRFDVLDQAAAILVDLLSKRTKQGAAELRRKKYIQWSVLQHYEVCATPLLDFTHSLRVAASFAQMENVNDHAYVYVFGLPYITNRISINSEHDLINIRLLSICPPEALRPYFQEGYLAATSDIEQDYDSKTELDFNRKLIAKFRIPMDSSFWGGGFEAIPKSALYPENDVFNNICRDIETDVRRELKPGDIGEFLKEWSELEELVIALNRDAREHNSFFSSLKSIRSQEILNASLINEIDKLRRFRNNLVHKPGKIEETDISSYMDILERIKREVEGAS